MLRGGFCFPCSFKAENSFNCYQNAYSFNDPSYNSNHFPQPQYKNYLCNLCGNNSIDGYNCQQQFPFVYEQEPSYNQNYDDNYYPYDLPSFPCCDNCGESHETFQCQPITQNINFFDSDQIQTPHYPDVHPPSQGLSDEVFQANHSVQNKEFLKNSSNKIDASSSNQEKEEPPQESDMHQLIKECSTEVSEEQKQSMEDTMLELVKICQEKEFLCIHDNVDDLIEKDESNCDVPVSTIDVCDDHYDIFSDSKIDDDISVYDDDLEDIEYVEASLSDPEIVNVEEENVVQQEEEEVDLEDISQIQDIVLREKLLSITRLIFNIESLNDNPTPGCVLNSFESDNFLLDNFSPEFETFYDHSEETRSGNTTHADKSLPEYDLYCFEIDLDQERLINVVKSDIPNDSSNNPLLEEAYLFIAFDNSIPPVPRPPSEPPDAETDAGEEIPVMMNDKDKFDEDYHFFMFYKVFSLLSAESEDTIFDP
nr:hypothetical protein [Tanacetum cinerariifolium]